MKKILAILLCSIAFPGIKLIAQDPLFSQFYANPLYLSPSFAGASKMGTRISGNYRNQWPSIPKTFTTYNLAFDHFFDKIRSGVGAFVLRDVAGTARLSTTYYSFLYSFDFKMDELWHVRPGLSLSYMNTGLNFNSLVSYSEITQDPVESTEVIPLESNNDIDLNVSAILYRDIFWSGITLSHLLKPNLYFYNENIDKSRSVFSSVKYSLFGGYRLRLRGNLLKYYKESLTLAFLFEKQKKYNQMNLGAYYHINPLVFGIWYRGIPVMKGNPGHDAMVFLLGYQMTDFINLGYSYDLTISGLSPSSGGAHEISLVYHFKVRERQRKPQALPCPDI